MICKCGHYYKNESGNCPFCGKFNFDPEVQSKDKSDTHLIKKETHWEDMT